jgi:hypothetical protein
MEIKRKAVMRQRSASYSDNRDHLPGNTWQSQQTGTRLPQKHSLPQRFSLPQRPVIVDSTLAARSEDSAPEPPEHQPADITSRSTKVSSKPGLPALRAVAAPLKVQEPITNADFQMIPSTYPTSQRIKRWRWYQTSSPRMTILKLSLIGVVLFSVLGATLATAGGGQVIHSLFSSLDSAVPYNPVTSAPTLQITKKVHPIIQAEPDAGYDTPQQHDIYWNAACSAAVMTELLRAWGAQNVTIGQIIDQMSAHQPPYITPWGGLQSQNGWDYIAQLYGFQAKVQLNGSLSYNQIVRTTVLQGLPVVLGLRDNGGRYFPAFAGGGHFLIAVGGNGGGLDIVDSSLYRITFMPLDEFNYLWTGETVLITPAA